MRRVLVLIVPLIVGVSSQYVASYYPGGQVPTSCYCPPSNCTNTTTEPPEPLEDYDLITEIDDYDYTNANLKPPSRSSKRISFNSTPRSRQRQKQKSRGQSSKTRDQNSKTRGQNSKTKGQSSSKGQRDRTKTESSEEKFVEKRKRRHNPTESDRTTLERSIFGFLTGLSNPNTNPGRGWKTMTSSSEEIDYSAEFLRQRSSRNKNSNRRSSKNERNKKRDEERRERRIKELTALLD